MSAARLREAMAVSATVARSDTLLVMGGCTTGRGPLSGSLVSYERRSNRTNDVAGTVWVVHQLTTQHRQRGEQSNGWATVPVAAPASGGP